MYGLVAAPLTCSPLPMSWARTHMPGPNKSMPAHLMVLSSAPRRSLDDWWARPSVRRSIRKSTVGYFGRMPQAEAAVAARAASLPRGPIVAVPKQVQSSVVDGKLYGTGANGDPTHTFTTAQGTSYFFRALRTLPCCLHARYHSYVVAGAASMLMWADVGSP